MECILWVLKKVIVLPIGIEKYRSPPYAKIRDNSFTAFFGPKGSNGSPYRPRPICSSTCRQDNELIELSLYGIERTDLYIF